MSTNKKPNEDLHFFQLVSHTPPEGMLLNPKRYRSSELAFNPFALINTCFVTVAGLWIAGFGQLAFVEDGNIWIGLGGAALGAVLASGWQIRSAWRHNVPRFIPDPDYSPQTRRIEKPESVETPKPAALPAPEPRPALPFVTRSIEDLRRTTARHDLRLALGRLMDGVPAWIERQGDLPMTVDRQRGSHLVRMLEERCREALYSQAISNSESAQAKLADSANEAASFIHGTLAKLERMEIDEFELKLRMQDRQALLQC